MSRGGEARMTFQVHLRFRGPAEGETNNRAWEKGVRVDGRQLEELWLAGPNVLEGKVLHDLWYLLRIVQ